MTNIDTYRNRIICGDSYSVHSIKPSLTKEWILRKHYAKRMPSISYSFGLFCGDMIGICTFGNPASPFLCMGVCGSDYRNIVVELNRLVINENLRKNVLSFFVASCLQLLPRPLIIVSYADTKQGHTGYIYQATNWIYTGVTKERTDIGSGDGKHSRHYDKGIDYRENRVFRSAKHRYVYFIGTKPQKKAIRGSLKYPICPYPKGDNQRYDASYKPLIQNELL